MPGLNRKGPVGEGPMTGRGMGQCNRRNAVKSTEEILSGEKDTGQDDLQHEGLGFGFGRRRGRGMRCRPLRGIGMRFRGNA